VSVSGVVYSVPPAKLLGAFGSRDVALKRALNLGKDPQSKAISAMIDGQPQPEKRPPAVVLFGFERLCAHLGRSFGCSFSPTDIALFDQVDAELKKHRLPLSLTNLIYGPPPVLLPASDDFPTVGHLEAARIQAAAAALPPDGLTSDDPKVDAALFDLSEWVVTAAARHDMLVGFSY
jgi:hypothetical protein